MAVRVPSYRGLVLAPEFLQSVHTYSQYYCQTAFSLDPRKFQLEVPYIRELSFFAPPAARKAKDLVDSLFVENMNMLVLQPNPVDLNFHTHRELIQSLIDLAHYAINKGAQKVILLQMFPSRQRNLNQKITRANAYLAARAQAMTSPRINYGDFPNIWADPTVTLGSGDNLSQIGYEEALSQLSNIFDNIA